MQLALTLHCELHRGPIMCNVCRTLLQLVIISSTSLLNSTTVQSMYEWLLHASYQALPLCGRNGVEHVTFHFSTHVNRSELSHRLHKQSGITSQMWHWSGSVSREQVRSWFCTVKYAMKISENETEVLQFMTTSQNAAKGKQMYHVVLRVVLYFYWAK